MSIILVILAVQVLVSLCGLLCPFVRPSEVWFVLDLLQHLVHWFSEYSPDAPCVGRLWLPRKVSPRTTICVPVRLEIPPLLRDNLLLPSALHLVFLYPLIPIWSISWRTLVASLPVRDFLKPCSAGRLLLNVLMATSSKFPSISLYISQYLPK